jgi:hypothetical protein
LREAEAHAHERAARMHHEAAEAQARHAESHEPPQP